MRVAIFAVVLTLTFIIATAKPQKSKRIKVRPIVGGANADISKYPYQVSVIGLGYGFPRGEEVIDLNLAKSKTLRSFHHFCGGSIISVNWVLCAAHCLADEVAEDTAIHVGSSFMKKGGKVHTAQKIIVHERYGENVEVENDIALIKVKQPFVFEPNVQPIPLNTQRLRPGMIVTVTGWGATEMGGDGSEILQKVDIPLVPFWECQLLYGKEKLTESMFCGGRGGHDSCQGDSGGPIVYDGRQVGVVSWGEGCALAGYPGVYTDIAKFRDWIQKNSGV